MIFLTMITKMSVVIIISLSTDIIVVSAVMYITQTDQRVEQVDDLTKTALRHESVMNCQYCCCYHHDCSCDYRQ